MSQNPMQLYAVPSLIPHFGEATIPSPLLSSFGSNNFVRDGTDRILADVSLHGLANALRPSEGQVVFTPESFELAGPREHIYWNSEYAKVAIVTCGGIAPGLNNVVQNIVTVLCDRYKVQHIYGVPFGYYGFSHDSESKRFRFAWRRLDSRAVQNIDGEAGSILGTGRGHSDPVAIVDALVLRDINILFTLGGDGTLNGAQAIYQEINKRNLPIGIIGIPKTIDNDVLCVSKSFGFESAIGKAVEALRCAQTEARGAFNGIGLVKLMGRNSGALTASAAAAVSDLDFVLVPEIELVLQGEHGFLHALIKKVVEKGYATIAVAEGAGQNLFELEEKQFDASGNIKLKDIGRYLQTAIVAEFKSRSIETSLKYIDPSYMLRAQVTTADDALFCQNLGQNAVHAAMAGKTGMMIGYAHDRFTHVPLSAVAQGKKHLDINGPIWLSVLAGTGQPAQWQSIK